MEADRTEAIQALLSRAEEAHGAYEKTQLTGVYDEQWPQWYATYAIEHGIGQMVGRELTSAQLAQLLALSYTDYKELDPPSAEPWDQFAARRLAAEL
jgi:hypothetical protein